MLSCSFVSASPPSLIAAPGPRAAAAHHQLLLPVPVCVQVQGASLSRPRCARRGGKRGQPGILGGISAHGGYESGCGCVPAAAVLASAPICRLLTTLLHLHAAHSCKHNAGRTLRRSAHGASARGQRGRVRDSSSAAARSARSSSQWRRWRRHARHDHRCVCCVCVSCRVVALTTISVQKRQLCALVRPTHTT